MASIEAIREALHRYFAACDAVDPDYEDGNLRASIPQDARYAVSADIRTAARAVLRLCPDIDERLWGPPCAS
jgi:hypothetical protein